MNLDCLSNLLITGIHSAYTFYNSDGAKGRRCNRPRWAVIMKYEGETVYTVRQRRYLSDASHIALLPKGCSYDWHCTRSGHFSIIEFESDLELQEPIVFNVRHGEKILKMFKQLERKRNMKGSLTQIEGIRDTYSIILALASAVGEDYNPSQKQQKIAVALEYVSENYDKPITNDSLAALTGLSTVYFRKLFTSVTGISPIAYAKGLRIQRAKEILRGDYGTLTDVAAALGYASLYDFSRDFKKHTGISPSKYVTKQPNNNGQT